MIKAYENKSNHNQDFLDSIHNDYPETYFDWKVTVQFYIALHKTYCVLLCNGKNIETNHTLNIKNVRSIDKDMGALLFRTYKNSRLSRYDGFMTDECMERINKINFDDGNKSLKKINALAEPLYSIAV